MNQNSSNQVNVPEARAALDNMKYEIARELGINLKPGYNGDLPSRQAGYIGGYMVKRMIEQQERQMSGMFSPCTFPRHSARYSFQKTPSSFCFHNFAAAT